MLDALPCVALAALPSVSLHDLAIVLGVAALTSIVFQRLRQPVVLGYLIAGILVGPYTPGATVQDLETIHHLSEIGMILVLFSIGLEFNLRRMVELGPRPAFVAFFQSGAMVWLGYQAGRLFGLDVVPSIFVGGIVAISSTVLIERVFVEVGAKLKLRDEVMGILVYEDLVGIGLLAVLSALAVGEEVDLDLIGETAGRLGVFLAVTVILGLLLVPRLVRFVIGLRRRETLVIGSVGLCFVLSLAAAEAGLSTALGAFLAGSLIGQSGHGEEVHKRTQPITDMFAAVFFVAIGMQVDPRLMLEHWLPIVILTAVVIVGKTATTAFGAFLAGTDRLTALQSGVSMAQVGEFGFIFAGLAVSTGTAPPWVVALAVGVSTTTAFTTPILIRRSDRIAAAIDGALPRRLQTYATLYTAWIEAFRTRAPGSSRLAALRRPIRVVLLDTTLFALLVVTGALGADRLARFAESQLGVTLGVARALAGIAVVLVCSPALLGVLRGARALGAALAASALPASVPGRPDPAAAPRRALILGVQIAVFLCVVSVLLAVTGPFLPRIATPIVLLSTLLVVGWFVWRAADDLQGHVRASAEVFAEALQLDARGASDANMRRATGLLPGLGVVESVRVEEASRLAGLTLADIDLRGRTGASVVAIARGATRIPMPAGSDRVESGDVLALFGPSEGVAQARALLEERRPPPEIEGQG
ncbi:MAG: cation:proton antiporter [Planctomycetes bacterium]|nr:cation:proton antiporter [Planctomycetota bacterium]